MAISVTYDEAQRIFNEDFAIEGWIKVGAPDSVVDPRAYKQRERALIDAYLSSDLVFVIVLI